MFATVRSQTLARIIVGWSCAGMILGGATRLPLAWAKEFPFEASWTQLGEEYTISHHLWLPDDMPTVRGLVVTFSGGCGSSLDQAMLPQWQHAARSLGFGLVGREGIDQDSR